MKDETKHIIAKEIYQSIKTALCYTLPITIVVSLVIYLTDFFTFNPISFSSDDIGIILMILIDTAFITFFSLILLYFLIKAVKSAYKWVMKWK